MLTYNREALVSRAIESVLAQTFRDFEFIIIDNGSSDRSGIIAGEYADSDNRIRVIRRERGNIGSGRNAGLDAANGEWIAFIDDDDWCEPDFLQFLLKLANKNNAEISMCGAYHRKSIVNKVMTAEEAIIELQWRKLYSTAFPTKLIKRKIFTERFSETSKYDDIELMARILAKATFIAFDGTPKYTFERELPEHNSSWTRNLQLMKESDLSEYLYEYQRRAGWLCEIYPDNLKLWRYFEWSFMLSMTEKVTTYELTDCYALRDVMLGILRENRSAFAECEWIQKFEKEWLAKYV
jgi:glycosyltransferase involved in cell wall biosynthesis